MNDHADVEDEDVDDNVNDGHDIDDDNCVYYFLFTTCRKSVGLPK